MADDEIALVLYGFGADLGDFKLFADDLASDLVQKKKFARSDVKLLKTFDRTSFFDAIRSVPGGSKIKELHVYAHSIGGGLYVGYHEATANAVREAAARAFLGRAAKIPYERVLEAEIGGILTDHLIREPLKSNRAKLREKFAEGAIIKLWGCNSGISGWVYSDYDSASRSYVTDNDARADVYYWRALNTANTPKPSIAQAFADYFGVDVYGAGSGSHIEVKIGAKWMTSDHFKKSTGRWPGAPQTLRLHPDRGDYKVNRPRSTP